MNPVWISLVNEAGCTLCCEWFANMHEAKQFIIREIATGLLCHGDTIHVEEE